jgi:chromodomain-helicase-DNA-binding protein 1
MVASKKASHASSSDDSEDDYGGRRKAKTTSRKRRKVADFEPREVRFTSRRAAKVVSYNESEDDFSEEMEEGDSYYAQEAEPEDGIDQVLDFRLVEGVGYKDIKNDAELKEKLEFYIKWQGQSHYHATWETWGSLAGRKGFRKLENYLRRVKADFARRRDPSTTEEDIEQMEIDLERRRSELEDYRVVERVVAHKDEDDTRLYLLKCK